MCFEALVVSACFAVYLRSHSSERVCIQKVSVSNFALDTEDSDKLLKMSVLPRLVDSRPLSIPSIFANKP